MATSARIVLRIYLAVIISQVIGRSIAKPTVGAGVDVMGQSIDKCRQKCIYKFTDKLSKISERDSCNGYDNCEMCWDYCELVPAGLLHTANGAEIAAAMCNDHVFCMPGCRFVCHYFRIKVFMDLTAVETNRID